MRLFLVIGIVALANTPMMGTWAHGGGLAADGCHNDRKNGGDIATVATEVHSRRCNALMAAVFIMRIALLPGQPVQLLFALASRDMLDIWIVTAMASAANEAG